jgi:MoaA/NifB/PqqE/SkfB family radical SAM enzyme
MLKKIADDIKKTSDSFGAKCNLAITGGDPLLHPNFWDLLSYLTDLGMEASIMGNPWTISDGVVKDLKRNGISTFQLSIDGMKKTHDLLRKKGSFDRTTEAIHVFQKN